MWNAPDYQDLPARRLENSGKIRLVHHGGAIRERHLNCLIDVIDLLGDAYELNLVLLERSRGYLDELKSLARGRANIRFWPPVAEHSLPQFLNQFDIGIHMLPPTNYNNQSALPNKLFEFIQARLAVAISPNPEMMKLVQQYDLGIVATDFSAQSLAVGIENLSRDQLFYYKLQANKAARELSSDHSRRVLLDLTQGILGE
jgi:hypothetical protein